jgi:predicted nuclease of predicted toxin-antitoxin system
MKFLADMGISTSTVLWLRNLGHDVTHVRELSMERASDGMILDRASTEKRAVLTCDLDFGDIMASLAEDHPTIILIRMRDQTPANVNRRLKQVLEESSTAITKGAIIIVEASRHRVRLLPVR